MNCKFLAYVLSQYLWIIILGLCLISTIQFKKPIPTGDIFSNSRAPYFNSSQDPIWFLHFTDIHLSSKKNNYDTILSRFNRSLSLFSPDHIAITGDIADNYRGNKKPIYYEQMEADWKLYTDLISDLYEYFNKESEEGYQMNFLKEPLHVSGNHDIFNVFSFDSKRHFANGILYNKTNSVVSRYDFSENITFVKINPFTFPSGTSAIIWWISPGKKIRSEINGFIQKLNIKKNQTDLVNERVYRQNIVLGHVPARMWFPSFSNILSNSENNVRVYLSGHLHPTKPQILHHGQSIEVVGTPLFRHNEIGIAAFDNGHFSYHQMNLSQKKFAILTFPNPDTTKSSMERFDEPIDKMQIRAISFTGKNMNLSFKIDEGKMQKLNCEKRLKNRKSSIISDERYNQEIYLCTKVPEVDNINEGTTHTFTKLGDWEGNFTFTVGDKINSFNEECYFDEPSGSFIFCFFLYLVFLLMIVLPLKFLHFADRFDDWLESDLHNNKNGVISNNVVLNGSLNWILATIGGFFVVESRIAKSPIYIRIMLNIAAFWSIVFPFCFFKIEDHIAVYWLWGFIVGNKSEFMASPTKFGCYYIAFVVAPFIIVVSGIQHTFSLFSKSPKKSAKSDSKKNENELRSRLNDDSESRDENLTLGGGCATTTSDTLFTSSEQGIGLGFDITAVDSMTLFKRKCVIMNIIDVVINLACFYKCYICNKELAKDFGDLFGFSSFIFTIIPAIFLIVLISWTVSTSLSIYKHRFDFTVSSVPLDKEEL